MILTKRINERIRRKKRYEYLIKADFGVKVRGNLLLWYSKQTESLTAILYCRNLEFLPNNLPFHLRCIARKFRQAKKAGEKTNLT